MFSLFPFLGSPFLPPCVWVASSVFSPSSRSSYSSFSSLSLSLSSYHLIKWRRSITSEEEEEEEESLKTQTIEEKEEDDDARRPGT